MLKNQLIEVCWNPNNRDWYEEKGYVFSKYREKFLVKAHDLPNGSNKRVIVICDYCNEETNKAYCDYTLALKECVSNKDACKKCKVKKSKDAIKIKYNVEHQSQIDWVIEKIANSEKLTLNEVFSVFENRNCTLLNSDYRNAKSKLQYKCNSHPYKIQETTLDNFKSNKYNCIECRLDSNDINIIKDYQEDISNPNIVIKDVIREEGYVYLSIYCKKHGKSGKVLTSNIKGQKYTCKECSIEHVAEKRKKEINEVIESFANKNLTLLNEIDYKNNVTKLKYLCNKHLDVGVQESTYANVRTGITCSKCKYESISGENHYLWQGGVSPLHNYMRDKISKWKMDSLKEYGFKCFITGKKEDLVVHHVKNFSDILIETMEDLNISIRDSVGQYSNNELDIILKRLLENHYKYGLGIPLNNKIHNNFHSIYGKKGNNLEQLLEFKENYLTRKISIV